MCITDNVSAALDTLLATWTKKGRIFDTLAVRDELRRTLPDANITYTDIFPEIWHRFRKGTFVQAYLIRTKQVEAANGMETTVEYLPVEGVVLKKVRDAWK
jgi:hypothetical protein